MLIEPQNANSGLKPAYYFEIFQVVASKDSNPKLNDWTVYKDKNGKVDTFPAQCGTFYTVDPTKDINNFLKY